MKRFRASFLFFVALISFSSAVYSQTAPTTEFPNIKIGNFGKMDERFYRGAQPLPGDFQSLKDLGINTVIDLRDDPTDYEKPAVEALGMKYVNIPMSGWKYAKREQTDQFMKIMNDPSVVAFVHCKAGKHRTGLVGAVYRLEKYGWGYDQAYQEMKNYNYSSWPVHFNIKLYVENYFDRAGKPKLTLPVKTALVGAGN